MLAEVSAAFACVATVRFLLRQFLLANQGRAAATVNRRLAALRAFTAWARRQGLLADDPTEGISDVPVPKQAPKALEERTVDRVLRRAEQAGDRRNFAILMTLRHTGIRVAELCNLHIGDVVTSERRGTLTVRALYSIPIIHCYRNIYTLNKMVRINRT